MTDVAVGKGLVAAWERTDWPSIALGVAGPPAALEAALSETEHLFGNRGPRKPETRTVAMYE